MENDYWDWLAFISYKHDDIEWARWLQNKLEKYKLPSYLNDEYPGIRKDLKPIFRDETDLPLGYLTENIISALKHSKFLIVICSPTTPDSEYVGEEVQEFINLGKESMIIPFVIQGKPEECFPSPLLNLPRIPLGANVCEISKDYAAVKVIARLLGDIAVDKLWMRHLKAEEEEKERLLAEKRNLQMVQSRFLAKEAEMLIEQGDTCTASMLLIHALPKDPDDPTDRPITKEAIDSLRNVTYREQSGLPYLTSRLNSDINTFDVSSTGRYAALGLYSEVFFSNPVVSVIDLITGALYNIANSSDFHYGVDIIHFSSDGSYLLAGHYISGFRIWNTETWKATSFDLKNFIGSFYYATWLGSKNILIIAGSNINCDGHYSIIILYVENNTCRPLSINNKGIVHNIVSSSDGKYVAYDTKNCLYILDVVTGQHILHMNLPKEMNLHYIFNPSDSNEIVIYSKEDHRLFSLNIDSKITEQIDENFEHPKTLAYTKDGSYMAWGSKGLVCRFNLKTHLIEDAPMNPDDDVICITFSWDGKYIVFATSKGIYTNNCNTHRIWRIMDYDEKDMTEIDIKFIANTYKLCIVSNDRETSESILRVLDLFYLFELTSVNVNLIEMSNDCRYLAYYNEDKELYLADTPTMTAKRLKKTTSNLCIRTRPMIFSQNSVYMAVLYMDGTVSVFDLESGKEYHSKTIKEYGYRINFCLKYSQFDVLMVFIDNQSQIAFIVDEYVCVWDFIANIQLTNKLEFEPKNITYNKVNNTLIITGKDYCIWDLTDNHLETLGISCRACYGKHIVLSDDSDQKFHIINIETDQVKYVEVKHHVRSMAISSDGKYLAMENVFNPQIYILNLETQEEYTLDRYTDSDTNGFVNIYFENNSHNLVTVCITGIIRWLLDEGKKEVYKNAQWVCAKVESDITVVLNDGRIQFRKYIPDNELISTFNKRYKSRSLNDTERLKYYIEDI